jgi:hypothetical protein
MRLEFSDSETGGRIVFLVSVSDSGDPYTHLLFPFPFPFHMVTVSYLECLTE